jgi:hypothetical protein
MPSVVDCGWSSTAGYGSGGSMLAVAANVVSSRRNAPQPPFFA